MMGHEVGNGHFAAQDEGDRPRQETDGDQDAAEEFEQCCDQRKCRKRSITRLRRKGKKLHGSVFDEQEGRHDPQDGQGLRLVWRQALKK
jgi:hypothetical protein